MALIHVQHESGRTLILGSRKRPDINAARLRARTYLKSAQLPAPPTSTNFWAKATDWLANVLANDTTGDCTGAGVGHLTGAALLNGDNPMPLTVEDVLDFFHAAGGTDDGGADEVSILNYWRDHGIKAASTGSTYKIQGWLSVDADDPLLVKQCLALFQILYYGIELPQEWIDMMQTLKNGDVWDIAGDPNPDNGHCVVGIDIDVGGRGIWINSWGYKILLTWAAMAKYCTTRGSGELYTAVTPGSIVQGTIHNPLGVTWNDMLADFAAA